MSSHGGSQPRNEMDRVELSGLDDEEYIRQLDQRVKQLYDQRGNQGVTVEEIWELLNAPPVFEDEQDAPISFSVPSGEFEEMLKKELSKKNKSDLISYAEFQRLITKRGRLTREERRAVDRFILWAIQNVVWSSEQRDFLQMYTCRPPPIFMVVISIIEIVLFAVFVDEMKRDGTAILPESGFPSRNALIYKPDRRYEAWRYLTYMLVHSGYVHLISNLVVQLLFGIPLEIVHKWLRVMVLYFGGVLAGSLAHSVTDPHVALVGASGGCYAILGGHLASIILNWSEMNHEYKTNPIRFVTSAPASLLFMLTIIIGDTGLAVYNRFFGPGTKVGITAHIGGLLAGLMLGVPTLKNLRKRPWEKICGLVMVIGFLFFIVFCVFFNGFYKGYPPTVWT
ncbi:hypothetical protein CHS0354_011204 [Potamilus streckersoni]|uniref:Peptidase S54 rhomboid domain-containing protein n=1 Tax=Potamilus streckersoni TaxID=2493646 RepID=A0AAE0W5L1_9BIVA|nr:hypothetical protein CHS0354_011204 [Potamilus streckersoni]